MKIGYVCKRYCYVVFQKNKAKLQMKEQKKIKSAFEVDENHLIKFYSQAFEDRMKYLPKNWQWLNRCDFFDNKTPLVIEENDKVIAHAGLIPIHIWLESDRKTAAWFVDFKILEQFQRQGLGSILTREWINFADCCVTFCNEKSIGVFKKIGWQENFNTFQHFNFMRMFDHPAFIRKLPAFVRKIMNIIVYPFFFLIYKIYSYGKKDYKLEKLTDKNFAEFYELYKKSNSETPTFTTPIRDEKYAQWRVLQSPNREKYLVYSVKNFSAILLIHDNHSTYIDILWVSDNRNRLEIKKMIATLGVYGLKNRIAYIRFYTSHKEISNYLKKTILSKIKHLRFAFFSKNSEIIEKMKRNNFDFELIDSDFEHIK